MYPLRTFLSTRWMGLRRFFAKTAIGATTKRQLPHKILVNIESIGMQEEFRKNGSIPKLKPINSTMNFVLGMQRYISQDIRSQRNPEVILGLESALSRPKLILLREI